LVTDGKIHNFEVRVSALEKDLLIPHETSQHASTVIPAKKNDVDNATTWNLDETSLI